MESGESKETGLTQNTDDATCYQRDSTGKPALANPNPSPALLKASRITADKTFSCTIPFHRTHNFALLMVTVIAICMTITVLALTGNLGGASRPAPFDKKEKSKPTAIARTLFKSTERSEIKDMLGKQITVIGHIDRLELDDKGRYLIFKDSEPNRDVMIFFDKLKTETSEWILKRRFAGLTVRATGTVNHDGHRLLLELNSMDDLKLNPDEPAPTK